jgi:chemotaxis protein MotA
VNLILGSLIVLGCVAGGFVLSHGHLAALWQPYELLVIGGAAFGAFFIANPMKLIKAIFGNIGKLLGGSKYNKELYMDALALLYDLLSKARKEGLMALESDVEEPDKSPIFKKYPKIESDHHVVEFITDYLRMMVGGNMNPIELESLMDVELDTHHGEAHQIPSALTRVSDGLPGFGIVAAVLGIVITMGALGGPPAEIGHHVASALVGTFLGILLAYGFVGPMATFLEHISRDEGQFYICLKTCLLASLQGYAPQVAIEFGRKTIFSTERPSFKELEQHVKKK